jgi:hypothetical protein
MGVIEVYMVTSYDTQDLTINSIMDAIQTKKGFDKSVIRFNSTMDTIQTLAYI